ncbi:MAG: DUF2752 domain-containing protein [Actinomycetota bacterium]
MASWAIGGYGVATPRWIHLVAVALAPVGCAVLYLFDPSDTGLYPLCPFRVMTGLWCPGCGTTRAMSRLLHGRVADALTLNVLAVLMVPLALYAYASSMLLVTRGTPLPRLAVSGAWLWALGLAIVAFGILRNVPVYPFSLLVP